MKDSLRVGLSATRRYTVDEKRAITHLGGGLRTYATPEMLRDIERTCRLLALDHLDEGEDSVGAHVTLDHLGPTLMGMEVEVTATIVGLDGRRIAFDATVRDALAAVGKAHHVRFVVDKAREKQRLEAKAAKLAEYQAAEPPGSSPT
jgi:predicted thioesterase